MRPIHTFHVLEILKDSPSVPLQRKGSILTDRDSRTVKDVYQQWVLLLMDLGYLTPTCLLRSGRRLWSDLLKADVLDLNNAFSECLASVRTQNFRGFKALCSRISPHLFSLIKDDIGRTQRSDVFAAGRLSQLFSYTGRLSLQDIDLTQEQLESYRKIEEEILHDLPKALVQRLNKIIKRWIKSFCPVDQLVPSHGPGSVADTSNKSRESKYKSLGTDQLLEYCFGKPVWLSQLNQSHKTFERTSKTIFVAKSYKSFRTISMEPATLQYFQQSVWKVIDRSVARNGYLKNHLDFHDQSRNQRMAKEGSSLRNYATIDLSAASDSVSYELVKEVFKGTWLLRYIVATRSRQTLLPDGSKMTLKKFAPMGSTLCFPVESLIFAAICEHVTWERGVTGDYSVFGDDIIVPTQCVDLLMRCLSNLGFRVNREKSFFESTCWFRESCGGEYFDGYDATPMRVSRKYSSLNDSVRIQELIDLANSAYDRRFSLLRQFFVRKLLDSSIKISPSLKEPIRPLFSPESLKCDNYSNYHTKSRWNPRLQRIEVKVHQERSRYTEEDLGKQDEVIRYYHWLDATADRLSIGEGYQSVICSPITLIKSVWVQKPYDSADHEVIARNLDKKGSSTY